MEFDDKNAPFIRLPEPHKNIIITPPRYSDGDAVIEVLNDSRVYMNLAGPPFPYTPKDWEEWFPLVEKATRDALIEWKDVEKSRKGAGSGQGEKIWVGGGLPVSTIREVDPVTGERKFVGAIGVRRREYMILEDQEERRKIIEQNEALKAGDPEIAWEMGFYLAPSLHGRGIMPSALRTLIAEFMVPYMNVHVLTGDFFEYNSASRRVFEKTGFELLQTVSEVHELPESKTGVKGKKIGLGLMRWKGKQ